MHIKDFNGWNIKKQKVDSESARRIVDTKRLAEKVEFMDRAVFAELKKRIKNLF